MNKRRLVLAAIGIFLAGLVTGGVATGAYIKYKFSPFRMEKVGPAQFFMERLEHSLRLTDEQAKAIKPIVEDVLSKLGAVRKPCLEAEEALLEQGAQRIREFLDDKQKERFRKFLEHGRKFRGRLFGPPPPPGLGPPPPPPPPGE